MGQSVEVVVSELDSAAARLDDAAQRLRDGLSGVDDETMQLLGSGWKGGAASAYAPAWEKWHDGAQQVVEGLQRMSELLTIAGKEYAKTDESASGALGTTVQGADGAVDAQLATAVVEQAEAAASQGNASAGPAPVQAPPVDPDEPARSVERPRSREV
ncbi:WXG100 family type VII secretion target [Mycolicibacterium sp. GCM10028919]|uniref:WXG100 family type VII secretion target n=1 Tax=Mycolicibacterium sp. GCM10028919 TaxID=3273401 RepID=UPI0036172B36